MSSSLQRYGQSPSRLLCQWDSPGKNTGVGRHGPPPGDLPDPGIEAMSPTLAGGFFTTGVTREAHVSYAFAQTIQGTAPRVVIENK